MLLPYVVLTQTVTLLAGGFVTLFAIRAYRRTGAPALRALAVGLGLVTVGALLAGVLHHLANVDVAIALAAQSTANAVGFAVLAYSLYAKGPTTPNGADRNTRPPTAGD